MNRLRSPRVAQVALWTLALIAFTTGLPAAVDPHAFYTSFPFTAHWVELLPPYNEHLVTDVGGLYLGFALTFAWAARTLDPTLARAVSAGWLLTAALHLIFHATHLNGFDASNAIGQMISLALLPVPALVALWAVAEPKPEPAGSPQLDPDPG